MPDDTFVNPTPNPGSREAIERGCTCPIVDNAYGRTKWAHPDGWWITEGCPLHNPPDVEAVA